MQLGIVQMEKFKMTMKKALIFCPLFAAIFMFPGTYSAYSQNSIEEIEKTISKNKKEQADVQAKKKSIDNEITKSQSLIEKMNREGLANTKKYEDEQKNLNALKRRSSEYSKEAEAMKAAKSVHEGNYKDSLPYILRNSAGASDLYGNSDLIKRIFLKYSIKYYSENARRLDFEQYKAETAKQSAVKKTKELEKTINIIGKNIRSQKNKKASLEQAIKNKKEEKIKLSKREQNLINENNKNYAKLEELKNMLKKAAATAEKTKKNEAVRIVKETLSTTVSGKIIYKDPQYKCIKIKTSPRAPVKAIIAGKVPFDGYSSGGVPQMIKDGKSYWITDDNILVLYGHLILKQVKVKNEWTDDLRHAKSSPGDTVALNESIAYAGNDGIFHLCVMDLKSRSYVDAEKYVK